MALGTSGDLTKLNSAADYLPYTSKVALGISGQGTDQASVIVQGLCESRGGRPGLRPNEPSGFRGRNELLNHASALVTTCP